MSRILALNSGRHDASCAYFEDGEMIYSIEEERMNRIKSGNNEYFIPPKLSLEKILEKTGLFIDDMDYVVSAMPKDYLVREFKVNPKKVTSYNHHYCHAVGSYFTSNYKYNENVLLYTHDGAGDFEYSRLYTATKCRVQLINRSIVHHHASAALLYGVATESFGWKINKDEGKTVGLAGNGKHDDYLYSLFEQLFHYGGDLNFYPVNNAGKFELLYEKLYKDGWYETMEKKAIVAYNLQEVIENEVLKLFDDIHKRFPIHKKIALSGGLFANVKLNQKINELPWVEEIYVVPPMGDNGLALGAGYAKMIETGEARMQRFKNMFFGVEYSQDEIDKAFEKYEFKRYPLIINEIAEELNDGKIVGWFKGRFEHGPRALGARSILVRPTDRETHEYLNNRLQCHEIMPFAPIVLAEKADEIFYCDKSKYTAEFMTLCYTTRDEWVNKIPAVIHHVDKSSRPQIVYQENNPFFYRILKEYYKVSEIPVLLNTSFNGHGEPIINTPENAFDHLEKGTIDLLVIENFVYRK
jgi:carbamoyltransferase